MYFVLLWFRILSSAPSAGQISCCGRHCDDGVKDDSHARSNQCRFLHSLPVHTFPLLGRVQNRPNAALGPKRGRHNRGITDPVTPETVAGR